MEHKTSGIQNSITGIHARSVILKQSLGAGANSTDGRSWHVTDPGLIPGPPSIAKSDP